MNSTYELYGRYIVIFFACNIFKRELEKQSHTLETIKDDFKGEAT